MPIPQVETGGGAGQRNRQCNRHSADVGRMHRILVVMWSQAFVEREWLVDEDMESGTRQVMGVFYSGAEDILQGEVDFLVEPCEAKAQ